MNILIKKSQLLSILVLPFILFLFAACNTDRYELNICDYGAESGAKQVNTALAVRNVLQATMEMDSVKITFPKGVYHFYVDSLLSITKAFDLTHRKNITIDGRNSEFIFHGPLVIGTIDSCSNIKFENFSIDWERPYISQGMVRETGNGFVDLEIDKEAYPYDISSEDSLFYGIGEDWKLNVVNYNVYDKESQEIAYRTRDMPLGKTMFVSKARELKSGLVRFFGSKDMDIEVGSYVALWHGKYMTDGFYLFGSKDITFRNIDIFHCPSHGLVGVRCENVSICDMNMKVNEAKHRVFSLLADALHFNACKGVIKVDSCTHTGQGDDFINVHSMYVEIAEVIDRYRFRTGISGRQNMTIDKGDELWFLSHDSLKREAPTFIQDITSYTDNDGNESKIVTLRNPMPSFVKEGDFVENKSFVANFEIRNCNILKKHRARGILVTTPGKVVIENNYFRTAGAAILIEGDVSYWYESGANENVQIKNNVFEDCFTSGHEWGEAVITITPSYRPKTCESLCFHQNIAIENNIFKHYDYALLYARAVRNLSFKNNEIQRTYTYKPFYRKAMFFLDGCKQVSITDNLYGKKVLGMNVVTEHMRPIDLVSDDKLEVEYN